MSLLRQRLLRWFPFLGALHRLLHSVLDKMRRQETRLRNGINYIRFDIVGEERIQRLAKQARNTPLDKPIIHLYAACHNEERIIPYFMDHYQRFVDAFFIYDNMSTDSSVERLSGYANVTIIASETGGTFTEELLQRVKNTEWKQSRGRSDFVIACDMDEFLYHPEMAAFLHLLKRNAFTVAKPHGYDMVSEHLPEFDGVHPITQVIRTGFDSARDYSKTVLFSPALDGINFTPGCHKSKPTGRIKRFQSSQLKLLHYKFVDRDLISKKTKHIRDRVSENDKRQGWNKHYLKPDDQVMQEFDFMLTLGRTII